MDQRYRLEGTSKNSDEKTKQPEGKKINLLNVCTTIIGHNDSIEVMKIK